MFNYENWLLDISQIDENGPCFVPYEDNKIIFGLNLIQEKCPGKLIGVIHCNGQEAVEKWIEENPNFKEKYC